jgi:hypothetical protein
VASFFCCRLAKTDAIDATLLEHFAEVMKPELRQLPDPDPNAKGVDHATQLARTDDDGRAEPAKVPRRSERDAQVGQSMCRRNDLVL